MNTWEAFTNGVQTFWGVLRVLFAILFVGLIAYLGYQELDDAAYVPHSTAVDLSMSPNWLVGENRDCLGFHNAQPPNEGLIITLECPPSLETQETHNVTVRFWGKIVRPYSNQNDPSGAMHNWRCTRENDGFVCKARD